jgi:hypothetical protein
MEMDAAFVLIRVVGLVIDAAPEWTTPAYIDPSSGGMLFQLLAVLFAFFSGIVFFFSRQIKTAFARIKRSINETFKH